MRRQFSAGRSGALRAAALVAGVTLALAACGGGGGGGGGGQKQTGSAYSECDQSPNTCNSADPASLQKGGELAFALEKNVSNWNVTSSEGNVLETGLVMKGVLPSTFVTQPDLSVKLNDALLDSAQETNTNPQTIVYKIKQNAVWSDGTPINADDFIYNWKTQNGKDCKDCTPATTSGMDQISSVVGSDNGKTVTVTYAKPYTDWKNLWSGGAPIYPAHIAAQHGDNNTPQGLSDSYKWFASTVPNYSGGPYQIDSFKDKESITLVPNPKWYGPKPHLDRIVYRIITDATQEPLALQNNEVQVIYPQPQVDLVSQVRNIPNVSSFIGLGLTWEHIDLNLANKFLAAAPLRQALFTAVDRQAMINKTVGQFTDKVKPLDNHNFMPQQQGYQDVISDTGQGTGNIDKAKQILTQAGYKLNGDKLMTPQGEAVPSMRVRYTAGNQIRQTECELFAAAAKQLGVDVQVVPTDDLGGTLSSGDYDMMIYAWVSTPFPSSGAIQLWGTGQGNNFGHYSNPQVDKLLADAASSTDQSKAYQELNQADQIMSKDAYVLPLYQKPTFIASYDSVANIRNNSSLEGPQYNIEQWGLRAK
jgi:peptide/nickel transport system substrate-binding protein